MPPQSASAARCGDRHRFGLRHRGRGAAAPRGSSRWTNTHLLRSCSGKPGVSRFLQATVPPLPFAEASFDAVISFQVIDDISPTMAAFVREIARVLRPGGRFVVTTPNAPMSLTRNPWHVREYRADELRDLLLGNGFASVERLGVFGDERVAAYYERNRRSVARIARFDVFLDLQHRLAAPSAAASYDLLNRINRRRLLRENTELTASIRMEDYRLGPVAEDCFDLFT